MEQALRSILEVVQAAGGRAEDIVRLTWFVINKVEYVARQRKVGEAYRGFWDTTFRLCLC